MAAAAACKHFQVKGKDHCSACSQTCSVALSSFRTIDNVVVQGGEGIEPPETKVTILDKGLGQLEPCSPKSPTTNAHAATLGDSLEGEVVEGESDIRVTTVATTSNSANSKLNSKSVHGGTDTVIPGCYCQLMQAASKWALDDCHSG